MQNDASHAPNLHSANLTNGKNVINSTDQEHVTRRPKQQHSSSSPSSPRQQHSLPPPPTPPVKPPTLPSLPPPPPRLLFPKPTRVLGQYIYMVLVALLWGVFILLLFSMVAHYYGGRSIQFCDSTSASSSSCIPCPPYGNCTDGILHCLPNYVRYGVHCIEDQELNRMAESVAGIFILYICNAHIMC